MSEEAAKQLIGSAPYFVVQDVIKAVAYYHDVLGFDNPQLWGEPPTFAMPKRDGFIIMLSQPDHHLGDDPITPNRKQGGYWDAYIWVNNVDALFAEFKANNATIDYEPVIQQDYGMKEFAVQDLDGYVIAFGQDVGDG